MKKLLAIHDRIQAGHLKSRLQEAGISCFLKNEHVSNVYGGTVFSPEIWIEQDEDLGRAQQLLHEWLSRPAPSSFPDWKCPQCGELVEGQFAVCWNCGASVPS
jgi:hypothetical protein